jgi:hypothetical protein
MDKELWGCYAGWLTPCRIFVFYASKCENMQGLCRLFVMLFRIFEAKKRKYDRRRAKIWRSKFVVFSIFRVHMQKCENTKRRQRITLSSLRMNCYIFALLYFRLFELLHFCIVTFLLFRFVTLLRSGCTCPFRHQFITIIIINFTFCNVWSQWYII